MSKTQIAPQPTLQAAIDTIINHRTAENKHVICQINDAPDLLNVLRKHQDQPIVYWSDRESTERNAAWGLAHLVKGTDALTQAQLFVEEHDVRMYGCLTFDDAQSESQVFWLPEWVIQKNGGTCFLHWHRPSLVVPTPAMVYPTYLHQQQPTQERWINSIDDLQGAFDSGQLTKVVFAQQNILNRPEYLGPIDGLQQLKKIPDETFDFCFSPISNYAFLGRSPERLLKIKDGVIYTEALAATRPRGSTKDEDEILERELLASEKETVEHQIVIDAICKMLLPYVYGLSHQNHPSIRKLSHVQHLYTPIKGKLKSDTVLSEIIDALHPTPAVCGTPRAQAMNIIRKTENFNRGWYAGPIGWIEKDGSEFAVAIRSALFTQNHICFWAGAGIVAQSDPLDEWQEIQTKGKQFSELVEQ